MLLALDSSTDQASIALWHDGQVLAEYSWKDEGSHSRRLLPMINLMLETASVSMSDLAGLAVASGPGSFNGIRVAISTGKALSFALDVPLAGIPTLDVIAYGAALQGTVCAVMNAGRGSVYAASYEKKASDWRRITPYQIQPVEEAMSGLAEDSVIVGDGAPLLWSMGQQHGSQAPFVSGASTVRRAGFLAELGQHYLDSGGMNQVDSLEPLYLRLSSAEEKARQREATSR